MVELMESVEDIPASLALHEGIPVGLKSSPSATSIWSTPPTPPQSAPRTDAPSVTRDGRALLRRVVDAFPKWRITRDAMAAGLAASASARFEG